MSKNIDSLSYDENMKAFKLMKQKLQESEDTNNKVKEIIKKLNKKYSSHTNNKLYNYIGNFIEKLIKILGNKIKIDNETIYLKDTQYIIDHDLYGNKRKETVIILESDKKLEIIRNHFYYKCDVIYYKDKTNNTFVYYDFITLQLLGISENNKEFKKINTQASIHVILSIKDCIMTLGLENRFVNLYHLNSKFNFDNKHENKNIIENYLRNRIHSLKQIISRIYSIIININNNKTKTNLYNIEENKIINDFTKRIKNFKTNKDNKKDIFKNWHIITNNIKIDKVSENTKLNISKNYFDTLVLSDMNNIDTKLIFYLIYNFEKLLDYNTNLVIQSEIVLLIIKLIIFSFNQYYKPYSNIDVRKFDFILINDTPYIDDNLKVVGFYQELLNNKEINDIEKNESDNKTDAIEENQSMDIDDYEVDDDIDGTMEAYDNDGE